MPLIDFSCPSCGPFEQYRPVTSTSCPPCPKCGEPTSRHWIAANSRATPDPIVVYRAPDGGYRFPGDSTSLMTAHYDSLGYQRIELRGFADVRRFEADVAKRDRSATERRAERESEAIEHSEKARRSDLYQKMQGMSEFGKAVARAAIDRNNAKPRPKGYDTGFHVDVYSNSRGSRDESRDADGRRRRD